MCALVRGGEVQRRFSLDHRDGQLITAAMPRPRYALLTFSDVDQLTVLMTTVNHGFCLDDRQQCLTGDRRILAESAAVSDAAILTCCFDLQPHAA